MAQSGDLQQKQRAAKAENGFFRTISYVLKNHRLGDLLVVKGMISPEQLSAALAEQKLTRERLGKVLVRMGYLSAFQLKSKLTEQWCLRMSALAVTFMLQAVTPSSAHAEDGLVDKTAISAPVQLASAAPTPRVLTFYKQIPQDASVQVTTPSASDIMPTQTVRQLGTLFGKRETKYSDMKEFKKWSALFNRFSAKLEPSATAENAGIAAWKNEINKMKNLSPAEKVEYVNNFINQRPYVDDKKVYGNDGYWGASPARFFSAGGDCKDYAITKYATLRALGFSHEQMRVAVVQDKIKRIAHAVLLVELGGETLVLDNQERNVKNASSVVRYQPIFAINTNNWWKQEA